MVGDDFFTFEKTERKILDRREEDFRLRTKNQEKMEKQGKIRKRAKKIKMIMY